jgi:hypothetical protein
MNVPRSMLVSLAMGLAFVPVLGHAHESSVYATGLIGPVKLDLTRQGNLLVAERGMAANDGRLSIVGRFGVVRPILTGLPSGIAIDGGPLGPNAPLVIGCCVVELTIGEGDHLRLGPAGFPESVPNPTGSVSPIFSSVLRLVFSRPLDQQGDGFALTAADHDALADGHTVRLKNSAGDKVWIRLVVDFKDARPDPVTNVRGSNPFHLIASAHSGGFLVVDSGQNSLLQLGAVGWPEVIVRFAPIVQAPGILPPISDAVPTAVRHYRGSQYLVSLLTGVPFAPGAASLRLVDVEAGTEKEFITGLTTATDLLVVGKVIYVLEISSNLFAGAPGRLLRFTSPTKPPKEVASGLIGPSGMVYDAKRDAIFISEIFTGRIIRVDR